MMAGWAFMECFLFGGLLYGWGSVEFVLKDEGIYADLCQELPIGNTTNSVVPRVDVYNTSLSSIVANKSSGYNVNSDNDTTTGAAKDNRCQAQDEKMALCFTIGSALFCVGCAILGHVSYKYGTRVTRLISL